jgi:hypothetical protein
MDHKGDSAPGPVRSFGRDEPLGSTSRPSISPRAKLERSDTIAIRSIQVSVRSLEINARAIHPCS